MKYLSSTAWYSSLFSLPFVAGPALSISAAAAACRDMPESAEAVEEGVEGGDAGIAPASSCRVVVVVVGCGARARGRWRPAGAVLRETHASQRLRQHTCRRAGERAKQCNGHGPAQGSAASAAPWHLCVDEAVIVGIKVAERTAAARLGAQDHVPRGG